MCSGGWCACEQNEISSFALFHLLSCSSDQALVTTRANTRIQVLENRLPEMKGQKIPPAPAGRVIKTCFAEVSAAEKLILRCSVRKVQVTMAATVWAALPPGVSWWLHGSDGRLSHSSGSPGNLVWGNAASGSRQCYQKPTRDRCKKWELNCQISPLSYYN